MRSTPWRWINGSTRPSALTRRLDDLDRLVDRPGACARGSPAPSRSAGSARRRRSRHRASAGRCVPRRPPSGCDSSRSLVSALLHVAFANAHLDRVAANDGSAGQPDARFAQHLAHVVAAAPGASAVRTSLASTSSRMCEPPCRSRPSTMWRCAHAGQRLTVLSGKKLGTASRQHDRTP